MLGGADNPNGELPSYITGADTVKDSTVNITKATVNTGTFASQNGTLIVDASSENTLDISGKASGDLRVYSAG